MGVSRERPATGDPEVIVIGGVLAGLCCARTLTAAGRRVRLLEASDRVGGRIRTERVDGFLVDRGFQVLLTAYPECRAVLDERALDLRPFFSGADIIVDGRVHRVADPWRHPIAGLRSLRAPVLSVRDALRVAMLRRQLQGRVNPSAGPGVPSTRAFLEDMGFSEQAIERFFVPFFGGIFLERDLQTPSTMFAFLYSMFAQGRAALPNAGMEAIPRQIAAMLPTGTVACNARVRSVAPGAVTLADGTRLEAPHVVIACDAHDASEIRTDLRSPGWRGTIQLAFAAERPPFADPILRLDADGGGPVHHAAVPSVVAPGYAPPGGALVSLTIIGGSPLDDAALEAAARRQVRGWFGPEVDRWRRLRIDRVPRALPAITDPNPVDDRSRYQVSPALTPALSPRVWRCGDAMENASINGAMVSGRRCAEAILAAPASAPATGAPP